VFEVDKGIRAPQQIPEFFPRDDLPRTRGQMVQDAEGLLGELQPDPALAQFSRCGVQFEHPETNQAIFWTRHCHFPDLRWFKPRLSITLRPRLRSGHSSFVCHLLHDEEQLISQ
jgi:hypothetical protein